MMKTGMVLEGGAMRGLFTAGVLDVMLTAGLSVDAIVGVSAGAAFGCNYKSRQIGRVLRYNKKYCKDPRFCSFRWLIKTGDLYGADFCYRELPETLERAGKALVIRPSAPLQIRHIEHDPAALQRVYDEGVAEGKRRLEEITAFIAARKEKEL